ncbi:MAG: hypothetical protein ACP5QN_00995 [Minisyncoccia bacterium]
MKKNKFLILGISFLIFSALGFLNLAEAQGFGGGMSLGMGIVNNNDFTSFMQQKFELWSKILNIPVDQVKQYWAEGKNLNDMIKDLNLNLTDVSNRMNQIRLENWRHNLQKLVDSGIITQDQMNSRLQFIQNNLSKNLGRHFGFRFKR